MHTRLFPDHRGASLAQAKSISPASVNLPSERYRFAIQDSSTFLVDRSGIRLDLSTRHESCRLIADIFHAPLLVCDAAEIRGLKFEAQVQTWETPLLRVYHNLAILFTIKSVRSTVAQRLIQRSTAHLPALGGGKEKRKKTKSCAPASRSLDSTWLLFPL